MTGTSPLPSAPRLLRERALQIVRADIVEGRLAPGARLTERELCERLGVSRTITREIVRQLDVERLVEIEPHRGLRVARLTPRTVTEIYEIRAELEALVARKFVATAGDAQRAELRTRFTQLQGLVDADDRPGIADGTAGFSRFLIVVSGHGVAGEILGLLHARINRLRLLSLSRPGRIAASLAEFSDLVDCLAARDGAGAERAVRRNVRNAHAAALAQLDAMHPTSDPD